MIKFVKTLRSTLLVIGVTMGTASTATAGSFDPAVMDPVVTPPAGACYPVLSERTGDVLYWTGKPANGNCVFIREDNQTTTMSPSEPDGPSCDHKDRPKKDKKKKGNASANNGKGGNYDKTGHSDNGKGNGKGRR